MMYYDEDANQLAFLVSVAGLEGSLARPRNLESDSKRRKMTIPGAAAREFELSGG